MDITRLSLLSLIISIYLPIDHAWNLFRFFKNRFLSKKPTTTIKTITTTKIPEPPEKWYIIGKTQEFEFDKTYPVVLQENKYVVWRDERTKEFHALENQCSHKGARLSDGFIDQGCVVCPYHFSYFNCDGSLIIGNPREKENIPQNYTSVSRFAILEIDNWIYMNPDPRPIIPSLEKPNIYNTTEETRKIQNGAIEMETDFNCNVEWIAEKMLDIVHYYQPPNTGQPDMNILQNPRWISKNNLSNHAQTIYQFKTGIRSISNKWFLVEREARNNYIIVESEFILPYTFITRIQCGEYWVKYVSSIYPVTQKKCRVYTKIYRNFGKNVVGDLLIRNFVHQFLEQDREILENIEDDTFLMMKSGKKTRYYQKQEKMIRFYRKASTLFN